MIIHMLGCLGKAPPDRSSFNVSDYIIQHKLTCHYFRHEDEIKDLFSPDARWSALDKALTNERLS